MVTLPDVQARLGPTPVSANILAESIGCDVPAVEAILRRLEGKGRATRHAGSWIRWAG